jgi:hypothetical protein
LEGSVGAVRIYLDAVVNDEFDGLEWVDLLGITAEFCHRVPHRGEVNDAWDAGKVLEQYAGWSEADFLTWLGFGLPSDETFHVSAGDVQTVLKPNKVFEENLHREGEAIELGFGCDRSEVVIGVGFVPYIQRFLGSKGTHDLLRSGAWLRHASSPMSLPANRVCS